MATTHATIHATTDNAVHTTAMPAPTSRAEPFRTRLHRMRVGCLLVPYLRPGPRETGSDELR